MMTNDVSYFFVASGFGGPFASKSGHNYSVSQGLLRAVKQQKTMNQTNFIIFKRPYFEG